MEKPNFVFIMTDTQGANVIGTYGRPELYTPNIPFRGPSWERRPWQEERRLQWWGPYRYIPRDGYIPEVRDYFTGDIVW